MTNGLFPLVLDGFPRCGSTTLGRVLSVHPDINCCQEPFHPKRYGGEFNRLALQAGSVAPSLRLLQPRWNALKHVWEPGSAWPFPARQDLNDDLVRHAESLISLRRRNILRQIVSAHISRYLRFWVGTSTAFKEQLDSAYLPPLSVEEAGKLLSEMTRALQERDKLLLTHDVKNLYFYYEDFFNHDFEHQSRLLNKLFVALGHTTLSEERLELEARPLLDPVTYKWADDEVYERVPGIHLVDKHLGNDVTGWLFS